MCLILDTNLFGDFFDPRKLDMAPVRNWIENKNGKIAYSATGTIKKEWEKLGPEKQKLIDIYRRAGKFKLVDEQAVMAEEKFLKQTGGLKSDDSHIVALALASKVNLLASEDQKLHDDFKRHVRNGKIYKDRSHKHLLTQDRCP